LPDQAVSIYNVKTGVMQYLQRMSNFFQLPAASGTYALTLYVRNYLRVFAVT
jgi:hypothetical protein